MEKTKPKVPFTMENGTRCICGKCPVTAKSQCSKDKMGKLMKKMALTSNEDEMPKPGELPALYCATGVASCKDLDMRQMCICGGCPVWSEYSLGQGKLRAYYCRDGKAI